MATHSEKDRQASFDKQTHKSNKKVVLPSNVFLSLAEGTLGDRSLCSETTNVIGIGTQGKWNKRYDIGSTW